MTKEAKKTDNDKDQFNFWGIRGTSDDPWDTLHAYFEEQASRDGRVVEESTTTGRGSPAK